MLCPTCQKPLTMSERQGIEIDYCPDCRGVWLDRGELDKIIERSTTQPMIAPQPRQAAQQPWGDHAQTRGQYPYKKRRKNFLEELFD